MEIRFGNGNNYNNEGSAWHGTDGLPATQPAGNLIQLSKLSPIIAGIVASIFLVVGLFMIGSSRISSNWKQTDATVVSYTSSDERECKTDSNNNESCRTVTYYESTLEYKIDGETKRFTSNYRSTSIPNEGDIVKLAYDPSNTSDAKDTRSSSSLSIIGFIFSGVGLIMLIVAVIIFIKGRSDRKTLSDSPAQAFTTTTTTNTIITGGSSVNNGNDGLSRTTINRQTDETARDNNFRNGSSNGY